MDNLEKNQIMPQQSGIAQKPTTNGLLASLNHPLLNFLWGLVGLIGVVFGVYTYYIQKPNLTCYISPNRVPVVRKYNINNLAVSVSGQPITNDLYLATIQFWNEGETPITKEDILKAFTIHTQNNEQIYQVNHSVTRDVVGLTLNGANKLSDSSFGFDWKILEKDDGILLQVLYGGDANMPLTIDGTIKQQKHITMYARDHSLRDKFYYIGYGIFVLLGSFLGSQFIKPIVPRFADFLERVLRKKVNRQRLESAYFPYLFAMLLIAYPMVIDRILAPSKPPFGF